MEISSHKDLILKKFNKKFDELEKGSLEDFLIENEEKINELWDKLNKKGSLYLADFYKKNIKSKRRWVKSELEKPNSTFSQEYNMIVTAYKKAKKDSKEDIFRELYSCENPEEYYKKYEKKFSEWTNQDSFFLDFPYIKSKRMSAIRPAVCIDIVSYLLTLKNGENIIKVPIMLGEIPEDTTNRIKFEEKDMTNKEEIDKQLYYNDKTGEEISLTINKKEYLLFMLGTAITEVDEAIVTEIVKQVQVFNSLDRDILQYVLYQTKEIYTAEIIERELGEIVSAIGRKNTSFNREAVKKSLYKLGTSGYRKNGQFIGRFFSVKLSKSSETEYKTIVRIYLDGMLREIILNNNTFNFYADKFNLLSKDAQKILINIQNERILRVLNKNEDLFSNKTYEEFRRAIYFKNARTIKPRVLSALDELIKYKMAIKSYEIIDKYEIRLEFFEFSRKDIALITGKDFKYGDFVDGSYDVH